MKTTLFFVCLFLVQFNSIAQNGIPYIRNYTPNEYKGHRQNWAIAQDNNGLIYVANGKGLLQFDGEDWSLSMVSNKGHIRSLALYKDIPYVGANNDLGIFQENNNSHKFRSFLEKIPFDLHSFGRVHSTVVFRDAIYFQSGKFIFRIDQNEEVKIWEFKTNPIRRIFIINNKLFALQPEIGLLEYKNGEFQVSNITEHFKDVISNFIIDLPQGWLFKKDNILMVFTGSEIIPFQNEAQEDFKIYGIDKCIKLKNNTLLFNTRSEGGVIILNSEGKLIRKFNKKSGLQNDNILNMFEDRQGSIWLASQSGISRIDIGSNLSFYTESSGLRGTVQDIEFFNGKMYVATSDDVMVLEKDGFENVNIKNTYIWDITKINQQLIISSSDGIFALKNDGKILTIDNEKLYSKSIPLTEHKASIVAVHDDGIIQAFWNGQSWIKQEYSKNIAGSVRDVIQLKSGELWLKTRSNGIFLLSYQTYENGKINFSKALLKQYSNSEGVPSGENNIYKINDVLVLRSEQDSIYTFSLSDDAFKKTNKFSKNFDTTDYLVPKTNEHNGTTWFGTHKYNQPYLVKISETSTKYESTYFPLSNVIKSYNDPYSNEIFLAHGNYVYFAGMRGICEYNIVGKKMEQMPLKVLLTKISTKDSIISRNKNLDIKLPYNKSNISFTFTAPQFKNAENKRYTFQLKGQEEAWSAPSTENSISYNNLKPGYYTFKVKAINDYWFIGPETKVSFIIEKPWYWNTASITLYVLALLGITFLYVQWRTKQLKSRNLELSQAVDKAVEETKRQAKKIQELYEVKNRFFANISHELRTPLTLILGPSEELTQEADLSPRLKNNASFIANNAKRLLKLINQLLDLSKLEEGSMKLKASQDNIVSTISTITGAFQSLAKSKGIELFFETDNKEHFVFFENDKIELIINNLLSNALKFSNAGDVVNIRAYRKNSNFYVEVNDTGIGINPDQLPYIFDRFYQVDNKYSRSYEGTGIGLSLTKELVELHGGTIEVESQPDIGTSFKVKLPFGKTHLNRHQIVKFSSTIQKSNLNDSNPLIEISQDATSQTDKNLVLVVEDNIEMRSYIKTTIQENNFVLEAENGVKGLELAKESVPDIIISDVMMPKMDGIEMCKLLKETPITSHIPIILLTAKASEEDKIEGLSLNADAYLVKPFNKLELVVRIQNLIANRKLLQKRFATTTLISPKEISVNSLEEVFLEKIVDTIETHIENESFGVSELADSVSLSRSQLHRKLLSLTNQTPSFFIRKYRLERAKQLLEKGAGRVSDIAYSVGFSSPSYFTKCFTETFGISPKDVEKRQ
ncbi:MAG: ATP-binding protein [Bacteroidota bacterium]